jgi:hypothetical protein
MALFASGGFATFLLIILTRMAEDRIGLLETMSLRPVLERAPSWLAAATLVAGWLLVVAAFAFGLRPAQWRATYQGPLYTLPAKQRKEAVKKIRGRLPVTSDELPLLRRVAESLNALRWTTVTIVGAVLLVIWLAMTQADYAVSTLFVVPALVLVALVERDVRAAKAFLRANAGAR